MTQHPNVGETWWLNDMLLLVLDHREPDTVRAVVLLDLDEVFDVGTSVEWRYDNLSKDNEYQEHDRRLT